MRLTGTPHDKRNDTIYTKIMNNGTIAPSSSSSSSTTATTTSVSDSSLADIALPIGIGIIGLSVGLDLEFQDFSSLIQQPVSALLGWCCQLVLLPTVGWCVTRAFGIDQDDPELAVGIILLTLCPGGSSTNFISLLAGGDGALSVTMTTVSGLVTPFTIPVILKRAIGYYFRDNNNNDTVNVDIDIGQLIWSIAILTLVPVVAGLVVKQTRPDVATKMRLPIKVLAALLLLAIILAAVVTYVDLVRQAVGAVGGALAVLIVAMMVIPFSVAFVLRRSTAHCITIAIESGIQYAGLAITIGLTMLEPVHRHDNDNDETTSTNTTTTTTTTDDTLVLDPERVILPAAVYSMFILPTVATILAWPLSRMALEYYKTANNSNHNRENKDNHACDDNEAEQLDARQQQPHQQQHQRQRIHGSMSMPTEGNDVEASSNLPAEKTMEKGQVEEEEKEKQLSNE